MVRADWRRLSDNALFVERLPCKTMITQAGDGMLARHSESSGEQVWIAIFRRGGGGAWRNRVLENGRIPFASLPRSLPVQVISAGIRDIGGLDRQPKHNRSLVGGRESDVLPPNGNEAIEAESVPPGMTAWQAVATRDRILSYCGRRIL
jgi:hypothetical protein